MTISSWNRWYFPVRASSAQRGFVLLSVLLIAVLYFGLIELLLSDASQRIREAQRFRSVISANLLAENAAELAAAGMVGLNQNEASADTVGGSMSGVYRRQGKHGFIVEAVGETSGVFSTTRTVTIEGTIHGASVTIRRTRHGQ